MLIKTTLALASPTGSRARLSILIFHRVLPAPDPLFPDEPCIERFDRIMGWVKRWFNVLPLSEAVERLRRGELPERAAAITFDDGYADNLVYATPVLKKHGLHATFFIATGFLDGGRMWNDTIIESVRGTNLPEIDADFLGLGRVALRTLAEKRAALGQLIPAVKHLPSSERTQAVQKVGEMCGAKLPDDLMLSSQQLIALHQTGMSIGAHTVNHPILATLDDATARREIMEGREFLERLLGDRVELFAYPNGKHGSDYTATHVDIVRSLGFSAAVATNWGSCSTASDIFQLPRFTPWDNTRFKYGLRLLRNACQSDISTHRHRLAHG